MICSQISIFEPLKTIRIKGGIDNRQLWFALKLVSLNHWKQSYSTMLWADGVVICSQISIFEPLKTIKMDIRAIQIRLWFALKLVSLNHWKQYIQFHFWFAQVVICSQISIFEPLKTMREGSPNREALLWFALKLVSLNHWKQFPCGKPHKEGGCDLLSN